MSRPDQPERPGPRPCEVLRRHRGGRPGPEAAELVGLDECEDLRPVGGEENNHEAGALGEPRVRLQPRDAELPIRGRHDVQASPVERDSEARAVVDRAARHPREALLDRFHRVGGRQKLLDVGLAKIEGHRGEPV